MTTVALASRDIIYQPTR